MRCIFYGHFGAFHLKFFVWCFVLNNKQLYFLFLPVAIILSNVLTWKQLIRKISMYFTIHSHTVFFPKIYTIQFNLNGLIFPVLVPKINRTYVVCFCFYIAICTLFVDYWIGLCGLHYTWEKIVLYNFFFLFTSIDLYCFFYTDEKILIVLIFFQKQIKRVIHSLKSQLENYTH